MAAALSVTGDEPVLLPNRCVAIAGGRTSQGQCRDCVFLAAHAAKIVDRRTLKRVAVHQDEVFFTLEKRPHFSNAARRAQDLRLERKVKPNVRKLGRQIFFDYLRKMVQVDDDLGDSSGDE